MALGCSRCRNSSVGRGSTPGNPLALRDGQNRDDFTKERGGPPSQIKGKERKKNAVSAGATPRKNVVLISMEIGAIAAKTDLFFGNSYRNVGDI